MVNIVFSIGKMLSLEGYNIEDLPIIDDLEYPCDIKSYQYDPLVSDKINAYNKLLTSKKIGTRIKRKH